MLWKHWACFSLLVMMTLWGVGWSAKYSILVTQSLATTSRSNSKQRQFMKSLNGSHLYSIESVGSSKGKFSQSTTISSDSMLSTGTMSPRFPRMVVAMIAHGWTAKGYEDNSTIKGSHKSMELALKGILRRVQSCSAIHFYFLTDAPNEKKIREILRIIISAPIASTFSVSENQPRRSSSVRLIPSHVSLTYEFVSLNETQLEDWMKYIGHRPSHRTGAAGNVKYFYPLLFSNEEKLLMLDSDILVDRDLCLLWSQGFAQIDRNLQQLFAFAPQWERSHPTADNQFNAGVGLLHLQRMRAANWLKLSKDSIENWHQQGMKPRCCAHGDQSAFHMVRYYRPMSISYYLPRWWNINKCHQYQRIQRNPRGSFVGIVHLGCCKMCTREKIGPRWRKLLSEIEEMKFIMEEGHSIRELRLLNVPVKQTTTIGQLSDSLQQPTDVNQSHQKANF